MPANNVAQAKGRMNMTDNQPRLHNRCEVISPDGRICTQARDHIEAGNPVCFNQAHNEAWCGRCTKFVCELHKVNGHAAKER